MPPEEGPYINPPSFEGLPRLGTDHRHDGIAFIGDEELREVLGSVISTAHLASSNGQWNTATVLVSSVTCSNEHLANFVNGHGCCLNKLLL